ncbi:MAG: YggT family protein [Betaproteobacteria bacterium]
MMRNALLFLCDVAFSLVVYPLLLRFWMQVLRAPFRNPLGETLQALTNWIVKPLRKIIPGWFGIDFATLLPALLLRWLWLVAELAISGTAIDGNLLALLVALAFVALFKASLYLLIVVVIVQAILSWVAPHGPIAGVLNAITFRFLRPIRRVVPLIGGQLDLSPLIVIVVCQLILLLPVAWLEQTILHRGF